MATSTLTAPVQVVTATAETESPFGEFIDPSEPLFTNSERTRMSAELQQIPAYANLVAALGNAERPA